MAAYRACEGWAALGDPSRLAIVQCLADRPRAVGELADELPISRPAVSQHRHLDRHGTGWESLHDGVEHDEGWPLYLDRYAALFGEDR